MKEYSADKIKRFATDALFCRSHPVVCVGPVTSDSCVSTMLQEAMCFSLQSALDGTANKIQITYRRDGAISIQDNGPKLNPNDVRHGIPVVELMLTKFHACKDAKDISRSNFNFGIVVTNALSKHFIFESTFDGSLWRQEFQFGVPLAPIARVSDLSHPHRCITFTPDDEIIQNTASSYQRFQEWYDECCGTITACQIGYHEEQTGASFEVASIAS